MFHVLNDEALRMEDVLSYTRRTLSTTIAATLFGIGAFMTTAGTASAYVACNRYGDCWHTDQRYRYAPDVAVRIHPDHWYFHRDWERESDRHWRRYHEGRGYYRNGAWITF